MDSEEFCEGCVHTTSYWLVQWNGRAFIRKNGISTTSANTPNLFFIEIG